MARIVLIEDDAVLRAMLDDIFRELGHETRSFDGGERVTGPLLTDLRPSMIVADLMLPGTRGDELVKKLGAARKALGIKVLLISELDEAKLEFCARACGADGFATKRTLLADPRRALESLVPPGKLNGAEVPTGRAAVEQAVSAHLDGHQTRAAARADCRIPFSANCRDVGPFRGTIENLSATGARAVAQVSLPVGKRVALAFRIEGSDVGAEAEVAWVRPGGAPGLVLLGLAFSGLDAPSRGRIEGFLRKSLPEIFASA